MSTFETKEDPFVTYLQAHAENRAMLAALRRGLGAQPGEEPAMFPYVVPFVRDWNEDDIYLIAALFALHPSSTSSGNIGDHLRRLAADEGNAEATERRFVQLLRMRRETLEPRLRQQVSILKAKDIPVNWHQLMADLHNWDHPDRFVQRRWAGAFWRANQSESNST